MTLNPLCCQQSLVLISKLPYATFFHSLLKILAPEYFEKQEPCLEAGKLSLVRCVFVFVFFYRYVLVASKVAAASTWLLSTACNDIDRWPTPHPGRILTLPIMGTVIKVPPGFFRNHTHTHTCTFSAGPFLISVKKKKNPDLLQIGITNTLGGHKGTCH